MWDSVKRSASGSRGNGARTDKVGSASQTRRDNSSARNFEEEWSDWVWVPTRNRYKRAQKRNGGDWEYKYHPTRGIVGPTSEVAKLPRDSPEHDQQEAFLFEPLDGEEASLLGLPQMSVPTVSSSQSQEPGSGSRHDISSYSTGYRQRSSPTPGITFTLPDDPLGNSPISDEYPSSKTVHSRTRDEYGYETITNPRGFFRPGRIFKTGGSDLASDEGPDTVKTYVVLQEGQDSAVCAPLQAVGEVGTEFEDGAKDRPVVLTAANTSDLAWGKDLHFTREFAVFLEGPSDSVDAKSRLDFRNTLEIDYSARVQNVGRIDRKNVKELKSTFLDTIGTRLSKPDILIPGFGHNGLEENSLFIAGNDTIDSWAVGPGTNNLPLHRNFEVRKPRDFEFGKVFKILWTEPKGQGRVFDMTEVVPTIFGEDVYTTIRRFVIARQSAGHCLCLPILTYNRQGTAKHGVKAQDHTIIYTGDKNGGKVKELEGEPKLLKKPIRMDPRTPTDHLRPESRLNYAKVYTVEHNIKVCFIGKIHKDSIKDFKRDFRLTHTQFFEEDYSELPDDADDPTVVDDPTDADWKSSTTTASTLAPDIIHVDPRQSTSKYVKHDTAADKS